MKCGLCQIIDHATGMYLQEYHDRHKEMRNKSGCRTQTNQASDANMHCVEQTHFQRDRTGSKIEAGECRESAVGLMCHGCTSYWSQPSQISAESVCEYL